MTACLVIVYGVLVNLCDPGPPPASYYYQQEIARQALDSTQLLSQLLIQRELTSPDRLPRCVPGIC